MAGSGWKYSDWDLRRGKAKICRLKRHIKEVVDAMAGKVSMSFDGGTWTKPVLENYHRDLKEDLTRLTAAANRPPRFMTVRLGNLL